MHERRRDREGVRGRRRRFVAVAHREAANVDRKVEAPQLKVIGSTLDATVAFIRSLAARRTDGPRGKDFAQLSGCGDIRRQELRAAGSEAAYSPKRYVLERVQIGRTRTTSLMDGSGNFDRVNSTGKLAIDETGCVARRLKCVSVRAVVATRLGHSEPRQSFMSATTKDCARSHRARGRPPKKHRAGGVRLDAPRQRDAR